MTWLDPPVGYITVTWLDPPSPLPACLPAWLLLQVISACSVSFAHGANDTANAVGPFTAIWWVTGRPNWLVAWLPGCQVGYLLGCLFGWLPAAVWLGPLNATPTAGGHVHHSHTNRWWAWWVSTATPTAGGHGGSAQPHYRCSHCLPDPVLPYSPPPPPTHTHSLLPPACHPLTCPATACMPPPHLPCYRHATPSPALLPPACHPLTCPATACMPPPHLPCYRLHATPSPALLPPTCHPLTCPATACMPLPCCCLLLPAGTCTNKGA